MREAHLIVTFNPPEDIFKQQLAALDDQPVIVVDNGSNANSIALLNVWVGLDAENRKLIELGQNIGIAAAQNKGMELAKKLGCEFVLLLDHDSIPRGNLLKQLVDSASEQLRVDKRFAALGARLIDPRSNKELGFSSMVDGVWRTFRCVEGESLIPCEFLNSSGSLIYLPAWEKIGPFDESFFIDHVETEWYMRVKAKGFNVFGSCQGILHHYLGDSVVRFWFFGWRTMPRRSGQRHYTIVRNSLWMYRRSYVPFSWKANNFAKLIFTLAYFSLFDKERGSQFCGIMRGFYDGLFGYPAG
ncbi:MAG: glycosyltransferase family 2 protein [Gammaproteobacteria bacterium]|nr:glycosyltransferase family 2 protein [Gammaproteobacteria bacterium]MBT5825745.1 glycosyltransferase family 2 protein [Gammaproteobacteria bacterium]MBT5967518.1 glycosyltransferase family 2 protein [Gammaproteobacteria bacterium]MBT6421028.1 glycosyltransferase family 2 protein [Gammaproteobacteria bacterium]MBT6576758.1 glycosyltransferase family 2 protein [Gammaproteobacteria bacterium]